ncbi:hypothetical protein PIB30_037901 [Stylosanthes scabra]|uniref:GRF-type domain-containing protein n=1 Tax=Stylosanthes scabra TaxID=79078 RepID=A0ABU6QDH5_9FABA|nr:hypothetical protein [Stylosanthes scabra]
MGPNREGDDGSSYFCPYPPGFGRCLGQTHSHSISIRVEILPQFEREAAGEVEGREIALPAINALPINLVGASEGSHGEEERPDEMLYCLNDEVWHYFHLTDELGDGVDVGRNGQVPCDALGVDGVDDNIADGGLAVFQAATSGLSVGVCDGLNKSAMCNGSEDNVLEGYDTVSEEPLHSINHEGTVGAQCQTGCGGTTAEIQGVKSGFEEEEVKAKLNGQKIEGKKRADLRPKVQRQGKKTPCIQGRTLATRKLSAGFCFVGGLLRARRRPTALYLAKSEWQPWFPPSVADSVAFTVAACRRGLRGGLNNSIAVGFGLFHRWPTNPHRRPIAALCNSAPPLRPCSDLELSIKRHKGMSYRVKSAGSGDSSTSGDRICKCGLIAQMKVSNSEANPRREYYSCPDGKCRWFRWAGPAVKYPVRVGSQNRERDAEESQVGLGSSLLEVECTRLVPSNESS